MERPSNVKLFLTLDTNLVHMSGKTILSPPRHGYTWKLEGGPSA